MSEEKEIVFQHPMIRDLEEVANLDDIEIHHADFDYGKIIVSVKNHTNGFDNIMQAIKFVDLIDRMSIHKVDFKTGEITVEWHPYSVGKITSQKLSKDEVDEIKHGRKILAIKKFRERTHTGLADAKNAVEKASEELKQRGVL